MLGEYSLVHVFEEVIILGFFEYQEGADGGHVEREAFGQGRVA